MSVSFDGVLVTVYVSVFVLMALAHGRDGALRPRDLFYMALWPLDLVWPLVIAAVAVLELCATFATKHFDNVRAEQRTTESV